MTLVLFWPSALSLVSKCVLYWSWVCVCNCFFQIVTEKNNNVFMNPLWWPSLWVLLEPLCSLSFSKMMLWWSAVLLGENNALLTRHWLFVNVNKAGRCLTSSAFALMSSDINLYLCSSSVLLLSVLPSCVSRWEWLISTFALDCFFDVFPVWTDGENQKLCERVERDGELF